MSLGGGNPYNSEFGRIRRKRRVYLRMARERSSIVA
jgi:hypothetical protein